MKVLHVTSLLDPIAGGSVLAVTGLVAAQHAAGLDVSIVSTHTQGASTQLVDQMRALGVDVHMVGPAMGALRTHPDINRVLEKLISGVDLVHTHRVWEQMQHRAARIARRRHVPYVVTPHGMLTRWSLSQKRFKKRLYLLWRLRADLNAAAVIHYLTDAERDNVAVGALKAPFVVIPIGVDLGEFQQLPPRGWFRKQYPQIGDRPLIAFMGRIHPGKGLEYLVPAFARVSNRAAVLVIIGPDSQGHRKLIEAMIEQYKLENRVVFTGMLHGADRVAALADADLFTLPSDHENFGLVVIEALAAGTPVVISTHVPTHRLIVEASVGAVAPQDPAGLALELDRWVNDHAARRAAAQRARPFAFEHYGWTTIGKRWIDHYGRYAPRTRC